MISNIFPGKENASDRCEKAHQGVCGYSLNFGSIHQNLSHKGCQHGPQSGQNGTSGNANRSQASWIYFWGIDINSLKNSRYGSSSNEKCKGSCKATVEKNDFKKYGT